MHVRLNMLASRDVDYKFKRLYLRSYVFVCMRLWQGWSDASHVTLIYIARLEEERWSIYIIINMKDK